MATFVKQTVTQYILTMSREEAEAVYHSMKAEDAPDDLQDLAAQIEHLLESVID